MNIKIQKIGILVIMAISLLSAQRHGSSGYGMEQHFGGGQPPLMRDLTIEQRAEVHELVNNMRSEGASRTEIHAALEQLFDQWGIELPGRTGSGQGHFGPPPFLNNLTEEQQAEFQALVSGMIENGATQGEIHAAVRALLEEWGIELPEHGSGQGHFGLSPFLNDLTEEQQTELQALVSGMIENGATQGEIHAAVRALLEEWGIELPEHGRGLQKGSERSRQGIKAQNHPNPFNPDTQITYTLQSADEVTVRIYNLTGQLVRSFDTGYQTSGDHSIHWNGQLSDGNPAPSGIYFYNIQAGSDLLTQQMLLLK